MKCKKIGETPCEQAENEYLRASVAKQKEKLENNKLLIQYIAEMQGIYIPEDEKEEEGNVQNFIENEGQI